MVSIFLLLCIPVVFGLFIVTILYGLIYYPIVFICSQRDNSLQGCYMTFLLPCVLAKGIFYGFRDIFAARLASLWDRFKRTFEIGRNLINLM
jgi:hypothetical protein